MTVIDLDAAIDLKASSGWFELHTTNGKNLTLYVCV